ncbi:MAG: tetratricopeptide repeat protein, partial [Desulfobacteraceae bacterium]|nr:tetratricopeptide repeat protein [Desulfobacteraceae bacterium]
MRFDDNLYVYQNGIVQSGITSEGIRWAFSINEHFYWHPLTWLSHMLDCQLYGLNAGMHHVTNLILHTLNSLLLFLVLQGMTGSTWRSAFAALLFAIHPINVESVAWISSRKNVLSTFFWLLTMAGYTLYCRQPNRLRYWLTLGAFTLGLMAKPMLVTLPCVLLLFDYWPLNRIKLPDKWRVSSGRSVRVNRLYNQTDHSLWHVILEKIPFFLFSCLAVIFSIIAVKQLGIDVTYESIPLSSRVSNALVSYWVYIRQIIWPTDLAFFYPFPETIPIWKPLTSAFFIIALLGLAVKFARKAPYIIIGWLWYLGTLVPAIGLLQAGLWPATSDRFAYVPSIGLFILAAWSFGQAPYKWRWLTPIKASFIATAFATSLFLAASHQIKTWQNSSTLFLNAISDTRNNFLAHHNLGNVYLAEGNLEKAIAQYDMALKADSRFIETHNSLAAALLKQGKIDSAISHLKKATALSPSNVIYRRNYNSARSL